MNLKTPSESRT